MGENTGIEWADHTFNPWIGCTKVSPGCDNCYAEALATRRLGVAWGPHAERRVTADSTWRQPLAWNRKAEREGRRARVFCASLADVFDNQVPETWRTELWRLISNTPHLDWLLLTKRPQLISKSLPASWLFGMPENIWLGTTTENQAEADRRIPHLLAVPAKMHFLSCEPLLGPVRLDRLAHGDESDLDALRGQIIHTPQHVAVRPTPLNNKIGWVIAGGESGPGARPCNVRWMRSIRDQCAAAGTPFFLKQWGEWWPAECNPWPACSIAAAFQRAGIEKASPQRPRRGTFGFDDTFREGGISGGPPLYTHWRLGKRAAGALLDGREHREVPHA